MFAFLFYRPTDHEQVGFVAKVRLCLKQRKGLGRGNGCITRCTKAWYVFPRGGSESRDSMRAEWEKSEQNRHAAANIRSVSFWWGMLQGNQQFKCSQHEEVNKIRTYFGRV